MNEPVSRRRVLGVGAGGVAAAGLGSVGISQFAGPESEAAAATPGVLDLYINEGFVPMVDGSLVYMRGFGERPTNLNAATPSLTISPRVFLANGKLVKSRSYPIGAPLPPDGHPTPTTPDETRGGYFRIRRRYWASFFPRRTIVAETGALVRIRVHNRLKQPHRFTIPGIVTTGSIRPGKTKSISFRAKVPGTYIYSDPTNPPVERVLGLHGALIVVPRNARWKLSPTGPEFERQWVWICEDIDPVWARRAQAGERINPKATPPVPRYFMLNGRSGFMSLGVTNDEALNHATHEETLPGGAPRQVDVRNFSKPDGGGSIVTGQLIRFVNVGVVVHQMHFHGNHVWTVRRNGRDFPRSAGNVDQVEGHVILQQWEDVVEIDPLDRKEAILPIRRPPETLDQVWDARAEDWHYPMHCHAEPSQTAAGGLYPGGLVADWVLTHPEESGETP